MALRDYALQFLIDAETKKAVSDIHDVGSALDGVSKLAGPAAVAGFAAIGSAAVAASVSLFKLTQAASDFGSEIFDASEKTGLHAETLSAMKFAAEQSGSSLETVTKATAKFAKTVGDASDGLQTATRDLTAFGITPQEAMADLDGALGKVFKRILDAKSGTEQMILAQKAFGRSGADLLPFIKSFNGDLDGLVRTAKEFGVTISDDAAKQADEFGDTMDTLNEQLAAVGRTIGFAVMPELTQMAGEFSSFLVTNRHEVDVWAKAIADSFHYVAVEIRRFANDTRFVKDFFSTLNPLSNKTWDGDFAAASDRAQRNAQQIDRDENFYQLRHMRGAGSLIRGLGSLGGAPPVPKPSVPSNIPRVGGTGGGGGRGRSSTKYASGSDIINSVNSDSPFMPPLDGVFPTKADLEKQAQDALAVLRKSLDQQLEMYDAQAANRLAVETRFASANKATEDDLARLSEAIEERKLQKRKEALQEYQAALDANSEEYKDIQHQIAIIDTNLDTLRANHATNEQKRRAQAAQDLQNEIDLLKKEADAAREAADEHLRRVRAQGMAQKQAAAEAAMATAPGTMLGGVAGGLGVDLVSIFDPEHLGVMKAGGDYIKDIYADVADFAGNAIGSMVNGLAQMGAAWLATGDFSAKAALQMVSAAAFSIATQAGFKAIFEYAEGLAAQAATFGVPNPSSVMHFAAASTYATVAAIAGGAGLVAGLGARALGSGSGSGGGSGGGGSSSYQQSQNQTPDPYSRQTQYAYQSGSNQPYRELAQAISQLEARIGSMRPGDVVTVGMKQKPGVVMRQLHYEVGQSAGPVRDTLKRLFPR